MFKRWTVVSTGWKSILYPLDSAIGFPNTYIHWIVIYTVDSSIQLLNNRGLDVIHHLAKCSSNN